jgi:hypothetical protein
LEKSVDEEDGVFGVIRRNGVEWRYRREYVGGVWGAGGGRLRGVSQRVVDVPELDDEAVFSLDVEGFTIQSYAPRVVSNIAH